MTEEKLTLQGNGVVVLEQTMRDVTPGDSLGLAINPHYAAEEDRWDRAAALLGSDGRCALGRVSRGCREGFLSFRRTLPTASTLTSPVFSRSLD